ncbi:MULTISPECIES: dihydrofolate reductase [unclassified Myroides]|uniref:dihydrofolate reductase n=1 Tax=unclassified Myroides TaxID=2642485 RepID=UPI0015FB816D|nr:MULTISPECIES: dihydrofolate reductase [unclassified Myroides]MBB1148845.1 dihydrofolate reductase [Myroides sp. NP-2]MDM1406557.1 dihydrofolate reductase [Myroides sp. DF42-4-2]
MVILIAAVAAHNVLGKDNAIIWHLPDDFKHFKALTSHHHIIMGRKTFESFPKPLPNRTHVIITRQKDYVAPENCIVVHSLEEALERTKREEQVYVIGGGEIYTLALPFADQLELTQVHASFEGDAFFPEFSPSDWQLVKESYHPIDEKHAYAFTFQTYIRK